MTTTVEPGPAGPPAPAPGPTATSRRRAGVLPGRRGRALGLIGLLLAVAVVAVLGVAVGSRAISPPEVWRALTAYDPTLSDHLVVRGLRIPRTLIGLAVGAALGLSGGVLQGVTRNPLADPGLLGLNAGASLAVVIAIFVLGAQSLTGYVWLAFGGAALAGLLVYGLGSLGRDGGTPVALALAGAAVSALLVSVTTAILLTSVQTFEEYRFWVVGSLSGRDWEIAAQVLPFLAVGAVLSLASARALDALGLGDDTARSLGQRVVLARVVAGTGVVLLCGAATAACGPIAFVGLAVPHAARALTGPDHRWLLPYSALMGAILLTGADIVGRVVTPPSELQVGVMTAVVGAPVFIALVRRRRLVQL